MEPGVVYMTPAELARIAEHLELSRPAFKRKYAVTWDRDSRQWSIDALDGRGCPLLTGDRGCSVHPVKPSQCATFPFWSEMLDDVIEWEVAKTFCPGMDARNGRKYSKQEIESIRTGRAST